MSGDWQTWAALLVVIATAGILIRSAVRRRGGGCHSANGCPAVQKRDKTVRSLVHPGGKGH